ncbi:hypothetical protein BCR34DRAFT_596663 [Clohesyomyces aquaticus]|uniref:Uncharacterized protein n=1 Tax=Clohesyomyces aquaticus TaxID=1231657 RepID=A0A1Y2A647_9PLEO|nr:hypothetical protein BCR34DRAFT_596663 [Clohesyomyces aquaticus]
MDWKLLDYAKEARDTASSLESILEEAPQYTGDIAADIAELYAISSALHRLHDALDLSHYGRQAGLICDDLDVCIPSLGHTLDHVRDMFSKSRRNIRQHPGAFPGTPPYDRMWEDACAEMQDQGISLPKRLEFYRVYLQAMFDILKGDRVDDDLAIIHSRLSRLLEIQEPLEGYFDRLSVNHGPRTPGIPSPVTARPVIRSYQTYPHYTHHPPPPPLPPRAPRSPMYGEVPYIPPPVPEIPRSPTYSTVSSQNDTVHSDGSSSGTRHWATKIFDGRHSISPFQTSGQPTKCLGRDDPKALTLLDADGFQKVLELPFEATKVSVSLYWRAEDNRARILFENDTGRGMTCCFPLTGLKVMRTESCLQFCRINRQDGGYDLWANLRFPIYERMVLFYCSVVAMKRQDFVTTPPGLEDIFAPGEKEEFGGEIQDDNYLHAFRIFRDRDSGCVRFEATARRGPLKTIPIWTAFVTQYIGNRNWMKRVGSKTVQLQAMHPYVFCPGYTVPHGTSGKYQLTFTSAEDAKCFMETFHRIRTR